jgi:hypothetical protein
VAGKVNEITKYIEKWEKFLKEFKDLVDEIKEDSESVKIEEVQRKVAERLENYEAENDEIMKRIIAWEIEIVTDWKYNLSLIKRKITIRRNIAELLGEVSQISSEILEAEWIKDREKDLRKKVSLEESNKWEKEFSQQLVNNAYNLVEHNLDRYLKEVNLSPEVSALFLNEWAARVAEGRVSLVELAKIRKEVREIFALLTEGYKNPKIITSSDNIQKFQAKLASDQSGFSDFGHDFQRLIWAKKGEEIENYFATYQAGFTQLNNYLERINRAEHWTDKEKEIKTFEDYREKAERERAKWPSHHCWHRNRFEMP